MNLAVRTGSPVRVTSTTSTISPTRGDLDSAPGAGGDDLVGTGTVVRRDHDLDKITFHVLSLTR